MGLYFERIERERLEHYFIQHKKTIKMGTTKKIVINDVHKMTFKKVTSRSKQKNVQKAVCPFII